MRLWISAAALAAFVLAPQISAACAVCFSSGDENRLAFTVTTVFMTALPLSMIGGGVLWLRRRALEQDRRRERSAASGVRSTSAARS